MEYHNYVCALKGEKINGSYITLPFNVRVLFPCYNNQCSMDMTNKYNTDLFINGITPDLKIVSNNRIHNKLNINDYVFGQYGDEINNDFVSIAEYIENETEQNQQGFCIFSGNMCNYINKDENNNNNNNNHKFAANLCPNVQFFPNGHVHKVPIKISGLTNYGPNSYNFDKIYELEIDTLEKLVNYLCKIEKVNYYNKSMLTIVLLTCTNDCEPQIRNHLSPINIYQYTNEIRDKPPSISFISKIVRKMNRYLYSGVINENVYRTVYQKYFQDMQNKLYTFNCPLYDNLVDKYIFMLNENKDIIKNKQNSVFTWFLNDVYDKDTLNNLYYLTKDLADTLIYFLKEYNEIENQLALYNRCNRFQYNKNKINEYIDKYNLTINCKQINYHINELTKYTQEFNIVKNIITNFVEIYRAVRCTKYLSNLFEQLKEHGDYDPYLDKYKKYLLKYENLMRDQSRYSYNIDINNPLQIKTT